MTSDPDAAPIAGAILEVSPEEVATMGVGAWFVLLATLGVAGFLTAVVLVTAWVVRTARIPRPVPVRARARVRELREGLRRGEISGARFQSEVIRLGRNGRA